MYECRKCGHRFGKPEAIKLRFNDGHYTTFSVCPLCRSRSIVEMWCATCDFYKNRELPCGMGHRTIVPFNIYCREWNIRAKNKPKVI